MLECIPWLVEDSIPVIDSHLSNRHHGLEFGMGDSTVWLAERLQSLVTFEHNVVWYNKTHAQLANRGLSNVTTIFQTSRHFGGTDHLETPYYPLIENLLDDFYDFVLVDGRDRVECFKRCLAKLKDGALIVLDDSQREAYDDIKKIMINHQIQSFSNGEHTTSLWILNRGKL